MKITIDEELEEKFKENLKLLPTKEEFFDRTDKIMKDLKDMREERTLILGRVYDDHEPRIERIEKKLNLQPVS